MPESLEKSKIPTSPIENNIRLVDVGPKPDGPIPREIKTWMDKVEDVSTPTTSPSTDPSATPNLVTPIAPTNPKVTLPVTRSTFIGGFKKTWESAGFWLSTFLLRLIKIKQGEVVFKSKDGN